MTNTLRISSAAFCVMLVMGCQSAQGPAKSTDSTPTQKQNSAAGMSQTKANTVTTKRQKPAPRRANKKPPQSCQNNSFTLKELAVEEISLSNQDIGTVARLLGVMGYSSIELAAFPPGSESPRLLCEQLPLIVLPSLPGEEQLTFNGILGQAPTPNGFTGDLAVRQLRKANSGEIDRLLVFYHPEHEDAFLELSELVREKIDTAATQVYIETLVLEMTEEDSKELGVEWESANIGSHGLLTLGLLETKTGDTTTFQRSNRRDIYGDLFSAPGSGIHLKLRALVESGRAQIISRPSILALSNRQAVIQIVDVLQTPRVQSAINDTGNLVISAYEFEPLPIGITLNLRPRVSADRKWVSLEIDATVEAEVDENSGEIYAPDPTGGRILLAEKTGSASRKVKTFARIPDRTPIIIGGLSAGRKENQKSRIPFLGELPVIGALFGATDNEVQKREVMIVLTPHVLAEDAISVTTNAPTETQYGPEIKSDLFQ